MCVTLRKSREDDGNGCVDRNPAMPQLQAFIDMCHKITCDFIRGRGHKVPDKHVSAHMGKLGLKKLCEALESKYKGHAPRMELVEAFGVLDVNGDGLIEQQELRQVMEQCKFGGPKLKGLKVSRTEALSFAACSRVLTRRCRRSWRGCACRRRRRRGTWTCRSLAC